ncbi:MAG: hypothetical protein H6Q05_2364 [Acidobacteria bacterium]|nr:hypothetical protein [Acidobacteriota bacterium]
MKHRIQVGVLVSLILFGLAAVALYANVLLRFSPDPEIGGGPPFYARIERLENGVVLVHNDGEWAAITFYRDPAIVPADFNLLDFFDPGLDIMSDAARESLTVEGFEIWRIAPWEPGADSAPIQEHSFGLGAVPIWFVKMGELEDAYSDGALYMTEMESLPSLNKGSAVYFKETLHPSQAAQQTKTQVVAKGTLDQGGSFLFQVEETHDELKHVVIQFK